MARKVSRDLIYEALLEMHFHSAVIAHFSRIYGANFLKLLKPSPKQEAFVGFDQGWVYTSVSTSQLFNDLQNAVQSSAASASRLYIGYFMQFKVVRNLRRSRFTPAGFPTPYLRSELDVDPNKTTNISQHETLLRLSNVANASVCYACGILFDLADLYRRPDLKKLRCVPVRTAPALWTDNDRHFIAFRNSTDAKPKWCSDPVDGESLSFDDWASPHSPHGPKALSPEAVLDLIKSAAHAASDRALLSDEAAVVTRSLPESFTLLEFEKVESPKAPKK